GAGVRVDPVEPARAERLRLDAIEVTRGVGVDHQIHRPGCAAGGATGRRNRLRARGGQAKGVGGSEIRVMRADDRPRAATWLVTVDCDLATEDGRGAEQLLITLSPDRPIGADSSGRNEP